MNILKKMFNPIRKKIKGTEGETLTETLGSLLIIVPAMVMLAGAIVTASRINYEVRHSDNLKLPTYASGTNITGTTTTSGLLPVVGPDSTYSFNFQWKAEGAYCYFN